MTRWKQPATAAVTYRPPMPLDLRVFRSIEWGAPAGGDGPDAEAARLAAYRRWRAAVAEWRAEHGHLPLAPGDPAAVGDMPFCGADEDHDCGGADCSRRPPRIESRNATAAGDV